jgi:hypothetical protein
MMYSVTPQSTWQWIGKYLAKHGIDQQDMSEVEWELLVRLVPCRIRCWRVGVPVEVGPGEECPECGRISEEEEKP